MKGVMMTLDYIKKLEKRIHNQRVALRDDWVTRKVRLQNGEKQKYTHSKWLRYALKLYNENRELKQKLKRKDVPA